MLPAPAAPHPPRPQREEQLCEAPAEEALNLSVRQRVRRAAGNLARFAWLLLLFSPVVFSAPLIGDFLGISRARWLRLLR